MLLNRSQVYGFGNSKAHVSSYAQCSTSLMSSKRQTMQHGMRKSRQICSSVAEGTDKTLKGDLPSNASTAGAKCRPRVLYQVRFTGGERRTCRDSTNVQMARGGVLPFLAGGTQGVNMSTLGLRSIDTGMPKPISAKTHGFIDYAHAGFFLSMAFLCRKKNPRAAAAAAVTGGFVLVQSLLTDYPLGVKKVLSFEAHGKMDAGFAAVSPLMPKLFGFSGTAAARVFEANGFIEGSVVALTDFDSVKAHREAEND
jgi:hypothetical protein